MIKLQVIGHLGKDSVVNTVNGKSVINFSVAHSEKFKDAQGAQKERTIWVECAYWTDRTAIAPYLKKGTQVFAEGQPDIRSYTTNDGRQGASLQLRITSVQLLGSSRGEGDEGNSAYKVSQPYSNTSTSSMPVPPPPADISEPVDDLPF